MTTIVRNNRKQTTLPICVWRIYQFYPIGFLHPALGASDTQKSHNRTLASLYCLLGRLWVVSRSMLVLMVQSITYDKMAYFMLISWIINQLPISCFRPKIGRMHWSPMMISSLLILSILFQLSNSITHSILVVASEKWVF